MLEHTRAFLAARAVPGIEEAGPASYRRTVRLADGHRVIELGGADAAAQRLAGSAEAAAAADAHLRGDPVLGPLVARRPGLRVPGTVDGGELAIRAVLGQQVSLAAARTLAGRLVAAAGDPLPEPDGALTHTGRGPRRSRRRPAHGDAAFAPGRAGRPGRRARRRGLRLAPGEDAAEARRRLLELPGIGPWTAEYVAMRALGDPDAWLPTDLGVRHALARLGAEPEVADAWRPFRAHAVIHLWAAS